MVYILGELALLAALNDVDEDLKGNLEGRRSRVKVRRRLLGGLLVGVDTVGVTRTLLVFEMGEFLHVLGACRRNFIKII